MQSSLLSALILSSDAHSLHVLRRVLGESDIMAEFCATASGVVPAFAGKTFDILVLDFDEPGAVNILDIAATRLNSCRVIIGVASDFQRLRHARDQRVQLVLQKPFTTALIARTVRAAQSLLVKERRASFRHAVNIKARAQATLEDGRKRDLNNPMLLDLSQGGICLQTEGGMPPGTTIAVDFQLPETEDHIHASGTVVWRGANGLVGIQFRSISASDVKKLREWSSARSPWNIETIVNAACVQNRAVP